MPALQLKRVPRQLANSARPRSECGRSRKQAATNTRSHWLYNVERDALLQWPDCWIIACVERVLCFKQTNRIHPMHVIYLSNVHKACCFRRSASF
jgi:hypothetical protein